VYDTGRDVYVFPVLFAIIVAALLLNGRQRGNRVEDDIVSTWQAVRELRRVPTELRRLPEVQAVRWGGGALLAVLLLALPTFLSSSKLFIATETLTFGIIGVSLVMLTGWAGHVSLGQMAFAAIGGAIGGWVTQSAGYDLAVGLRRHQARRLPG
nr:hypothetical protein [Acidimicrobiia bacterium]